MAHLVPFDFSDALFDQARDAVFIIGMDRRIITANQYAADLLGYTRDELMGMSSSEIVASEYARSVDDVVQRLLTGENVPVYERIALRKDGSRIPVEVSVQIIRAKSGEPLYIQSHTRDISDRKQAEKQALALALETERSRILADFIIAASHEFRTPLANINTSLHIMRQLDDPDARVRRIDQVQNHVDAIADLVSRMLLLTRLESDTQFHFVPVNLADILYDAEVSHARTLERADVRVVHCDFKSLPLCLGDANTLHLVFRELIDNAIKASSPGDEIVLLSEARGDYVIAEVRDEGRGINQEEMHLVFDRFFRADKSHHERGFGLGLSIVKLIVDQHGGIVEVESKLGRGSVFRVVLPRA